jgi:hypothetical protein
LSFSLSTNRLYRDLLDKRSVALRLQVAHVYLHKIRPARILRAATTSSLARQARYSLLLKLGATSAEHPLVLPYINRLHCDVSRLSRSTTHCPFQCKGSTHSGKTSPSFSRKTNPPPCGPIYSFPQSFPMRMSINERVPLLLHLRT